MSAHLPSLPSLVKRATPRETSTCKISLSSRAQRASWLVGKPEAVPNTTQMLTRVSLSATKSISSTMAPSRRTKRPVYRSTTLQSRLVLTQDQKWEVALLTSRARRSTHSLCQQAITLARSRHARQVRYSKRRRYQSKTKFTCLAASKVLTARCTRVWRRTVL